tara:strand:+ start:4981 stop:6186 length:1206 start_codon:yes stop_codon:yes gene_type:complete
MINKVHFYSLLSMPFLIVTGPLMPEIVILYNALFVIFNILKKNILLNNLKYPLCFFLIYLIALSLFSNNPVLSLESSLFYFRFFLLIIGINFALENYKNFEKYVGAIFVILLILLFFDSIIQYFLRYNIFLFSAVDNRISSFFGDELVMGGYLSRFYPLIICIVFYELLKSENKLDSRLKFLIIYSLVLIFTILIFLSGERSAFVTFLFSNFFLFIFLPFKRLYISVFITIIFIVIVIYFIDIPLFNRIFTNTYLALFESSVFMPDHYAIYHTSLNIIKDNFILGIGPKLFREFCVYDIYFIEGGCSTSPHNYYIQILLETGLIGLTFIILLLYKIIFNLIKSFISLKLSKQNIKVIGRNIAGLVCIFPFIPTGNFFGNWISIMIFFNLGFALQLIVINKK